MKKVVLLAVFWFVFHTVQLIATIKFSGVGGSFSFDQANSSLILSTQISNFDGVLKLRSGDEVGDNVVSSFGSIGFTDGVVQIGADAAVFTGVYDPGTSGVVDKVVLGDGDRLEVFAGDTVHQQVIVSSFSTATISGAHVFSKSVLLTDSTSVLNLGLGHKLGQDINLNGGKVVLVRDLGLKDGVRLVGDGIVDANHRSLHIGSSAIPWTDSLTFYRSKDMQLDGRVTLSGTWMFATDGADKVSFLNGNGNILDLSGGGKLRVGVDHTLYISDMHIKGLGSSGSFDLAGHSSTPGNLVLSNVTLELDGNYVHGSGVISIQGDNVVLISGGQYTFTIDGSGTLLNVDSVALYYETLGGTNTTPFSTQNGGIINTINGGVIRSNISNVQPVDIVVDAATEATRKFERHLDLRTIEKIVISNSSLPPSAQTVTIDGSGCAWTLPSSGQVITIADNVTVTFTNVVIKNFSLARFYIGASASVYFGDGVILELGPAFGDTVFDGVSSLKGSGNVVVRGGGNIVRVEDGGIVQSGIGKVLTLENMTLLCQGAASPISCTDRDALIKLKNVVVKCRGGNGATSWNWNRGSILVDGICEVEGVVSDQADGLVSWDWSSTGTLKILSGASLKFGRLLNFRYQPADEFLAGQDLAYKKRRIVFEDPSSTLICDGCMLTATSLGMAFDKGNLVINNLVNVNCSTVEDHSLELGSALNVEILAGSIFDIDGVVNYKHTSI